MLLPVYFVTVDLTHPDARTRRQYQRPPRLDAKTQDRARTTAWNASIQFQRRGRVSPQGQACMEHHLRACCCGARSLLWRGNHSDEHAVQQHVSEVLFLDCDILVASVELVAELGNDGVGRNEERCCGCIFDRVGDLVGGYSDWTDASHYAALECEQRHRGQ